MNQGKWATLIAIAAFVVSILSLGINFWSASTAVNSLNANIARNNELEEQRRKSETDKEKSEWAEVTVADILYRETNGKKLGEGMTIDRLRQQYITEAKGSDKERLGQQDFQEPQLKKILLSLMDKGRVYHHIDGKWYWSSSNPDPIVLDEPIINQAVYEIGDLLIENPGKYDMDSLYPKIVEKIPELRPTVYHYTVEHMLAMRFVGIDKDKKLVAIGDVLSQEAGRTAAAQTTAPTQTNPPRTR